MKKPNPLKKESKPSGLRTFEIRFANQELTLLRNNLLKDLSKEYFACLLAKRLIIKDLCVYTVVEAVYPDLDVYKNQGGASLRVDGKFMREVLLDVDRRIDVDTVIDVHTHPFASANAWFSGTDDSDEGNFARFLNQESGDIHYASIVLTQSSYKARAWEIDSHGEAVHFSAFIKTQKVSERIPSPDDPSFRDNITGNACDMFNRSVLALGLENMRLIANGQRISIVGVGGIGSIIAEHLIHMGFMEIALIDYDVLELSNMNRIVGVTYDDAIKKRLKVDAIKESLNNINPKAKISTYPLNVFDEEVEYILAKSDWIFIATDNHASRYRIQQIAFKYYVPFIAAGVNITVSNDVITDMSGEVILIRIGDKVCLTCLKRINFNEVAKELHPDEAVRAGLVAKGYVKGKDIKEPAVKTLNTHIATMAVDTLVNQYTERRKDSIILVYEDNEYPTIYEDKTSIENRNRSCSVCRI
ncbi:ThiF family adenylyltransferase [uncultured Acetatifactor sp.]|jgi:molybdopterin/thiamine biosynthesis adenylyltransferase|uniref:ThiF family adenylyltransferase n=1 Tax=uncultured Acetatifactor sp. TaxID=1671927 RepID=UPI00260E62E9|nr:ThiF family adenylyltransferase [uncultured Acetatifactor sp.]